MLIAEEAARDSPEEYALPVRCGVLDSTSSILAKATSVKLRNVVLFAVVVPSLCVLGPVAGVAHIM